MRFAGRFLIGLACGPGLCAVLISPVVAAPAPAPAPLPATVAAAKDSGQPYATIVTRNIFGLLPPPVFNPADSLPPPEPPPKITPNGIMSIFGKLQVLFKVAVKPPPGQPAKDVSYVMSEGERQDEIEVVKIDEKAGVVTFDNHGTPQELPLVAATATGPAPTGPGGPGSIPALGAPGMRPGVPMPFIPNRAAAGGFGTGGGPVSAPNPGAGGASPSAGAMPPNGRVSIPNNPPPEERLSPEAQIIMLEAQRAQWQAEGNPAAAILPATPMTEQVTQPPTTPPQK